jgi:hypothetical protein
MLRIFMKYGGAKTLLGKGPANITNLRDKEVKVLFAASVAPQFGIIRGGAGS